MKFAVFNQCGCEAHANHYNTAAASRTSNCSPAPKEFWPSLARRAWREFADFHRVLLLATHYWTARAKALELAKSCPGILDALAALGEKEVDYKGGLCRKQLDMTYMLKVAELMGVRGDLLVHLRDLGLSEAGIDV